MTTEIVADEKRVVPTDDKLGEFARHQHDVFERVRKGSLNPDEVMREVSKLIDRRSFFIPPEKQLELTRQRNAERHWGFTEADFEALGPPPAWPDGYLCAVVLDVSLDTVSRTFEEGWYFTKAVQPGEWRWPEVKSDENHLKLLDGIIHQRGLHWRVVDFAANWDKKDGIAPTVHTPKTSLSSAILWAASCFPRWIQAMDGVKVPFVWLPGYQLSISGSQPWSYVPDLCWHYGCRQVRLSADDASIRHYHRAVPVFVEC
ncbi:MAG: hypothetical protein A2912_05610 [Candidatus Buchananbacteria bacterium RIFCSPLOWO2_01_FULL_40_23b]|uniref:Uncharacterized protein n=1 Tax=Candidatus Buchananbacteria bacterium RIFCSPLOWO2_01_FULL_40_23b TaxID=1797544 RepID=A0A1G1YTI2_9BACT|nr:MAG: hypothetical protein A2912_05610 [Candidatus Buchananbacteria bacterium RIFCSPLOWO2_01_FULL_40_23b]